MKKFITFLVLYYVCATSVAQQQYSITNYTQEQGLPSGTIRGIYKDTIGYIWLTSEGGVSRFDGYNFKTFRHNPDISSSLPTNIAWAGAFPLFGDIYFKTPDRYCKYDPATESFSFNTPFGGTEVLFKIEEAKAVKECYWVQSNAAIFKISKSGAERFPIQPYGDPKFWKITPGFNKGVMLYKGFKSRAGVLFVDEQTKKVSSIKILDHQGMEDSSAIADISFTAGNFYLLTANNLYRFNPESKSFEWHLDLKHKGNFDYLYPDIIPFNDTLVLLRSVTGFLNIFNIRTGEEKLVYVNKKIPEADLHNREILCIAPDNNGGVWMGTSEMGVIHYNLFTGVLEQFVHETENANSLPGNFFEAVLPDENGILWASCFGHGLVKMEPVTALFKTASPIVSKKSINSGQGWTANIRGFLETDDGYWMGTMNGLFGYSTQTQQYSDLEDLLPVSPAGNSDYNRAISFGSPVSSFAKDQLGNLWIGTWYGDLIVHNTKLKRTFVFQRPQPLKDRDKTGIFRNLFCDKKNRMWISTFGAGVYRIDCNTLNFEKINETKFDFNFFDEKDSATLSTDFAFLVTEDAQGNIWAGAQNGLCRYNGQTGKWKRYYNMPGNENSIHHNDIRSLCLDMKGNLWIGTNGGGLNRYNREQDNFTHFTIENGLADDQIYTLVCDNNGMLWMGTNHGLCRFNPQDYSCKNFTEKDGIQNYEYNTGAALKLKDGTLLFGGVAGYNIIDPDKIENKKSKPPVVVISSFKIFDRETAMKDHTITLNYKENNLAFEFAALSYFRNQDNRYAYMLEGSDTGWVYCENRKYVSYSKLEPGYYTFKVKACNSDGVWNETGAQLTITITPPWWETTWARALYLIIISGSIIGYNRYRLHAFRVRQKELETKVEKATVTIRKQKEVVEAEKKRSDELLLNILPEEVAEELKLKGSADAKQFGEVTVMFTDFKGFTQISEKLSPSELVGEIDTCFKAFDDIIGKHNIEKIKTIGDSYMCAGGLPVANITNATDVVNAALAIQQFMLEHLQQRKSDGREIFEIRIGIHTGPVVAGIVGVKKFAYDIWGDTVNIASRMESGSEAGKVNISGSTYELVKDKFNCIHRGKIQAKNKGEIDMYFVDSIL